MKSKLIAIVGPTASGKTSLGIELAQKFNGEVISVDSRQVYVRMDIGTGKVLGDKKETEIEKGGSIGQLFGSRGYVEAEGVVHWGIDLVTPDVRYSAAEFKTYAEQKIKDIVSRGKLPILVGGTGFWLAALLDNYDLANTPADEVLRAGLEKEGIGELFARYKRIDPQGAETIDKTNKRKLVRALEVSTVTGVPFSQYQSKGEPKYQSLQIGLRVEREELYARINDRVESMVALGLVNEVRRLKDAYGCQTESMTGIGYRQVCAFLHGDDSLKEAIESIKQDSRRYAKRQETWFKRDERIKWIKDYPEAEKLVQEFM